MRIHSVFILFTILHAAQALAWHAEVETAAEPEKPSMIWLRNDQRLPDVAAYLAWFDLDGGADNAVRSWGLERGWMPGLSPVMNNPVDAEPFEAFAAMPLPAECPAEHRCFVAFVAVDTNATDPLDIDAWRAASLDPLSREAAYERLPGQNVFLTPSASGGSSLTSPAPFPGLLRVTQEGDNESRENIGSFMGTYGEYTLLLHSSRVYEDWVYRTKQRLREIDVSDPKAPRLSNVLDMPDIPTNYAQKFVEMEAYYIIADSHGVNCSQPQSGTGSVQLKAYRKGGLAPAGTLDLAGTLADPDRLWREGTALYALTAESCRKNFRLYAVHLDASGNPRIASHLLLATDDSDFHEFKHFPGYVVAKQTDFGDPVRGLQTRFSLKLFRLGEDGPADIGLREFPQTRSGYAIYADHLYVLLQNEQTLHLYIHDLTTPGLPLLGQTSWPAWGDEGSFSFFRVGEDGYAYIGRENDANPFSAADIRDPAAPRYAGELSSIFGNYRADGPSFSHHSPLMWRQNRLLDRKWEITEDGNSIALTLYDISDAFHPARQNGFALLGEGAYAPASAFSAVRDYNWKDWGGMALVSTWGLKSGAYAQFLEFGPGGISDRGRLHFQHPLVDSEILNDELAGILTGHSFVTAEFGGESPRVLGEVELGPYVSRLQQRGEDLWATEQTHRDGFQRLLRYTAQQTGTPVQTWQLPYTYQDVSFQDGRAVLYKAEPPSVQILDMDTGELHPPQLLQGKVQGDYLPSVNGIMHFLQGDDWYAVDYEITAHTYLGESHYADANWYLQHFRLQDQRAVFQKAYLTPGEVIGMLGANQVISAELPVIDDMTYLRFNLSKLTHLGTVLQDSFSLTCDYSHSVLWENQRLYIACAEGKVFADDITTRLEVWAVEDDRWAREHAWPFEHTRVWKWGLEWVDADRMMLRRATWEFTEPYTEILGMPSREVVESCTVYRISDEYEPELLGSLSECPRYIGPPKLAGGDTLFMPDGNGGIVGQSWNPEKLGESHACDLCL